MVTKEERDRDRAIAERVETPLPWRWWTSNSVRRLSSDVTGKDGDVAHGTIYQGCPDIAIRERDMAHVENAANRLPLYIADAEETARRLALLVADCNVHEARARDLRRSGEHAAADVAQAKAEGMREAIRMMRGEK